MTPPVSPQDASSGTGLLDAPAPEQRLDFESSISSTQPTNWRPEWKSNSGGARISLAKYLEVPFIHKWTVMTVLACSLLAGWLAILLWPRVYESEAKLKLKVGLESVGLDPTASTTSRTLMLQKTQQEEINSALEVLSSRQIAEQVVAKIGDIPIIDGYLPSEVVAEEGWLKSTAKKLKTAVSESLHSVLVASGIRDEISDHEMAVRTVQKNVEIYAPKMSNVITIHAEAKSPQMAQAIAHQLTETFLDQHLQISRTEGSQAFFDEQSDALEEELNSLVENKNAYMTQHKIVSIPANESLLREELAAIGRDLIVSNGALEQATAEIVDLEGKIAETPDEIVAAKQAQSDSTWSGMRQKVFDLEVLETEQAEKYTDDHVLLQQTRGQLAEARAILAKIQSERVNESRTPNPAKRRMREDLQKLQTRIVGLKSIIAEKESQRKSTQQNVDELHVHEKILTKMDRDIERAETSLASLRERQEEARVIDELQKDRISNVKVFQAPPLVERPASPQKKLVAAGFLMIGLFGGIGLAFLREFGTTQIRTPDHIESNLHAPVVSTIPRLGRNGLGEKWLEGKKSTTLRAHCRKIISEILLSRTRNNASRTRGRSLGVIGLDNGCGASTLASALSVTSSDDCGLKTTLIDADAQNRSVSKNFNLNGAPGLAELVKGDAETKQCIQHNATSELELISCSSPDKENRLDAAPRDIVATLRRFQQESDLVVIDLPSASQPNLAVSLAQHLDHIIVVVESGRSELAEAERLLHRLSASDAEVVGVVLNKKNDHLPRWIRRYVGA